MFIISENCVIARMFDCLVMHFAAHAVYIMQAFEWDELHCTVVYQQTLMLWIVLISIKNYGNFRDLTET